MDLVPEAFDRIENQQVTYRLALFKENIKAREIILNVRIIRIPRRLIGYARRIVALSLAAHAVPRQMVTAQIYAEQRLPVAHRFMRLKIKLPAGDAVKLA